MKQDAWDLLREVFRNTFKHTDYNGDFIDFADITQDNRIHLYSLWFESILEEFKKELEINFLEINRDKVASVFLLDRVGRIVEQMNQNRYAIDSKLEQKKSTNPANNRKNQLIIELLAAQNNALFGFMFSIKTNRLYKDVLKSESIAFETELERKINEYKPVSKETTTFSLEGNETQFNQLHLALNKNFIDASYETFEKIFKNVSHTESNESVKWIDLPPKRNALTNASTLFDFLYLLKSKNILPSSDFDYTPKNANNLYRKMECCFSDSNGNPIPNLRTKTKFKYEGKSLRSKELKAIIDQIFQ